MTDSDSLLGPPRGMRDFYPEDLRLRSFIFDAWRRAALLSGFEQYDSCVVESLDLLKRKSGEEIVDQIYAFVDKSGRELALRPEMTPTLARMVAARGGNLPLPLKWFAIAQCFRYERMSRGRKREHYQWNLDILGESDVSAEAEVMATAVRALTLMGLTAQDVRVHCNSRALLMDLMHRLGVSPEHHARVLLVLDKIGKIDHVQVVAMLGEAGLDTTTIDRVLAMLQATSLPALEQMLEAPTPAYMQLQRLIQLAEWHGIGDTLRFDISVVRGLTYYTGIVFEAFDADKQFRAIFGGGRYDNLLADIGGRSLTAVGLGFGDVVVAEILAAKNRTPQIAASTDIAIGFMDETQMEMTARIAASLRHRGTAVELALRPEKPRNFFARVGNGKALKAIYIGPDDILKGTVAIKDLATRQVTETTIAELTQPS